MSDKLQRIDVDGNILLISDDAGRYRYKVITTRHGYKVLLRDDGYRIHSIYVSDNPVNHPMGKREWELMFEYKHNDAPGIDDVVELIMDVEEDKA